MVEQIAVITTGGTIGSVIAGHAVSVDPSGLVVHEEIAKICKRRNLDVSVSAALNKHSEDLDPADWSAIANAVLAKIREGVRRIVITHGTDTLAYTAAICGLLFAREDVRVCLTGSFLPLEAENSDGPLNLIAAFRAVSSDELPTGVYVAFRASERNTQASIIPALLVKPMAFDSQFFEGVYSDRVATYGPKSGFDLEGISRPYLMPSLEAVVPNEGAIRTAASQVLQIYAYPGINLSAIRAESISALVVATYHSGTASSLEDNSSYVNFLREKGRDLPVYFASFPSRYMIRPYESTVRISKAGGIIISDLQPHVVFALISLSLAQGRTVQEIQHVLKPWISKF